jgi:tRNA1(Val) A37 N6-methylase TrmN6
MLADAEITEDAVLGGRLVLRQPRRGHRVGHDAILLAAATQARAGEHAVELGAGVGAAGLALARRLPGLTATLVEIDPALAGLARDNAQRNGLGDRVKVVTLDVAASAQVFAESGLAEGSAAHVMMNPPFNDPARQNASPDAGRRLAHVGSDDTLSVWMRRANSLLAPSGAVTLIWRADGLGDVLAACAGFGAIAVLPIHPKPQAAAIRVLVRAVKGSRAPLALLPGLTLNGADGKPSAEAEGILRAGAAIRFPP